MRDELRDWRRILSGRTCFVGLGNVEAGDDGFGVLMAQYLRDCGFEDVVIPGVRLELYLTELRDMARSNLVFLDSVDFEGTPGDIVLLPGEEIRGRFPQVTTHRISLGTAAMWIESNGVTTTWLLGVKCGRTRHASQLSEPVRDAMETLKRVFMGNNVNRMESSIC
ncbi:MAG: hydrogenase maturation protease [Verrucomicrobia bacterium]|nr:hydrogenase maturation protease [Verrucomicrobiota bacterium]